MRTVCRLILLFLCFGVVQASDVMADVPFTIERGFVIVKILIKNDVPVDVMIATGARHSSVDSSLLEKYKLSAGYAGVPPVTGRNDRIYFFSVVSNLRVGEVTASSLTMRLEALSHLSAEVGREIFGILGSDFFKGRVVEFDFSRKVLRFRDKLDLPDSSKNAADCSGGIGILEMLMSRDAFGEFTRPIANEVVFEGQKIKTLFDTGSGVVLVTSSSTAKKLGQPAPSEKEPPRKATLQAISLGGCQLNNVPIVIAAKGSAMDRGFDGYGMVVGIGVLQNFVVTFDFRKRIIVLDRR